MPIRLLTFAKNTLFSLTLQHVEIVQKRQHILWRVFDGEQGLKTRQNKRSELRRRKNVGNGKYIRKDIRKQMRVFHLPTKRRSVSSAA